VPSALFGCSRSSVFPMNLEQFKLVTPRFAARIPQGSSMAVWAGTRGREVTIFESWCIVEYGLAKYCMPQVRSSIFLAYFDPTAMAARCRRLIMPPINTDCRGNRPASEGSSQPGERRPRCEASSRILHRRREIPRGYKFLAGDFHGPNHDGHAARGRRA